MLFLLFPYIHSLSDDDFVVTEELVRSINENPKSTFKAVYYPKFGSMRLKDFKRFLSPVRKAPEVHSSARPVGFSERSFYNSDKRMFTGIKKEVICSETPNDRLKDTDYDEWHRFSDDIENQKIDNKYPASQFDCSMENIKDTDVKIRYTIQYPGETKSSTVPIVPFPVFDSTKLCSSWAPAVTSAMSTTLTRWSNTQVNLSIQFLLDCDILGDSCLERPPLTAYEQFWRRYIPYADSWENPSDPLRTPHHQLTQEICNNYRSCYPGMHSCKRQIALTGVCEPGVQQYGTCPIYFLYNWRWIKSHLAEVGAVTSSILVRPSFFSYVSGTYSTLSFLNQDILGMLDVTIIGWGQKSINLTRTTTGTSPNDNERWWYVIPHLGTNFGLTCKELFDKMDGNTNPFDITDTFKVSASVSMKWDKRIKTGTDPSEIQFVFGEGIICDTSNVENNYAQTGVMKFIRRYDDSNIESQAVGAVPYNFIPMPWRTLQPTWSQNQANLNDPSSNNY